MESLFHQSRLTDLLASVEFLLFKAVEFLLFKAVEFPV